MQRTPARDLVLRSLYAVSSQREAEFYTTLFQNQAPEQFAMILIDSRCLRNPLLKSFTSDLKILSNLDLTPILVIGALDNDRSLARYHILKLCKELEFAGIRHGRLNCASYEFAPHVRKLAASGMFPVLELTDPDRGLDLDGLTKTFQPAKMIILQPSGGLQKNGKRLAVMRTDEIEMAMAASDTSEAQKKALHFINDMSKTTTHPCTFVLASPLNLLAELFTTKGSGTMVRVRANINVSKTYDGVDLSKVQHSIEKAFGKPLNPEFLRRPPNHVYLEHDSRGGAIFTPLADLPYMSKFWVVPEATGEGIASDIWQAIEADIPKFFWRSRKDNPLNDWYMRQCDGMQISGPWRVFWKGLEAAEIPIAITAAASEPIDFPV